MSESTKDEFTERCKLLENIVKCWETGKSACQARALMTDVSSTVQSVVDCESNDMIPISCNGMDRTSTSTTTGTHVSGNGTEVVGTASVVEVPTSVVEAPAEIPASVAEVNQVHPSTAEVNQVPSSDTDMNNPTSAIVVS